MGQIGQRTKDELKVRPDWVVYVEADENVPWADAVSVIDIAKGLHAKAVLLTSTPSPAASDKRAIDGPAAPFPPKSSSSRSVHP